MSSFLKVIRFRRRLYSKDLILDLVVVDLMNKRNSGSFIKLGSLNLMKGYSFFFLNLYKLGDWLNRGASISASVLGYLSKFSIK